MAKMFATSGKVIITWSPNHEMPAFQPQVQLVDHPFKHNATISNSTTNATSSSSGGDSCSNITG